MKLYYAILQNAEGEIIVTYSFDDAEVCDDFADAQNTKLAERGLPSYWSVS